MDAEWISAEGTGGSMNEFIRNCERYFDPTAGDALKNVERWEKMKINAGDIITFTKPNGYTQDIPFAVMGVTGGVYTGVRLYDTETQGSVPVICGAKRYAQPDKMEWVNSMRADVGYVRTMSEEEYSALREAVSVTLGLNAPAPLYVSEAHEVIEESISVAEEQAAELIRERTRADIYEQLYTNLLDKYVNGAGA